MSFYWFILWIPYLFVLTYFFKEPNRRVYACIILIIVGILRYKLPVYFGYEARLFQVGLLWCLTLFIMHGIIRKSYPRVYDKTIWRAVLIFYLFLVISYLMGEYDRVPTLIYRLVDYSLLFFLIVSSIKNKKHIDIFLKGMIIAGFIMALVGMCQFILNDPAWGLQRFDELEPLETKPFYGALSGLSWRVWSTGSNPNSFGTAMVMVIPITLILLLRKNKPFIASLLVAIISIQIFGLILSGSRSAWLAFVIIFIILIVAIPWIKKKKISRRRYIFGLLLIALCLIFVIKNEYIGSSFFGRVTLTAESPYSLYDRTNHWSRNIDAIDFDLFLIGRGSPGISWKHAAHSNYLAIFYLAGFWGFLSFVVVIIKASLNAFHLKDKVLSLFLLLTIAGFLITGVFNENSVHNGPPYFFWIVIAILASKQVFMSKNLRCLQHE